MHTHLIILAAGMSSRMKRSADTETISASDAAQAANRSKALITVGKGDRPLLDYLLYNARAAGYQEIIIVKRPDDTLFHDFYGAKTRGNAFHGLNISFAAQHIPPGRSKPFGTADAIYQALVQIPALQKRPFTVCNSDNLYSVNAMQLLRKTRSKNALIAYDRDGLRFSAGRLSGFALCRLDADNFLIDIVEKPSVEALDNYRSQHGYIPVSMNIFKLNGRVMFGYLKNCPVNPQRDEKELPTAIRNMINDHPRQMLGIYLSEHVPDLTAKDDIPLVRQYLAEHYPSNLWENDNGAE